MNKATVDNMLAAMKKQLKEDLDIIHNLKKNPNDPFLKDVPKGYDIKDFQGQYTGLDRVVREIETSMRNQRDLNHLDTKPFYDLYTRLSKESLNATALNPQTIGYKSGIESGKKYLDALFIAEVKRCEKRKKDRTSGGFHR
jgi:hypothetical protein